jgi:uncharacterized membrane protein
VLASGAWYASGTVFAAAGVLVALVALTVSAALTLYSLPHGRLVYGLLSAESLLPAATLASDLQISYKDQILDDPQLLVVQLANEGGRDIPTSSFDDGRPLIFDLNVEIVAVLRNALGRNSAAIKIEYEGSRLKIGPNLIRRGDVIQLAILASGHRAYLTVQSPLIEVSVQESRRKTTELIPNVEYLRRYDELQPGASERILRMVEGQQQFKERMTRARFVGRLSGFVLLSLALLASMGAAIYIGVRGQSFAAGAIAAIGTTAVVASTVSLLTTRRGALLGSRNDSPDE